MNIKKMPSGVSERSCPGCGWRVSQFEIEATRFDFECPRCGKHKMSEFTISKNQRDIKKI
ncbi:hypothetical protein HCG45_21515 [Pseudomonas fulva]|uniref:hypothetical protein n=1 Tax=Pseudomonas fulva TaxID=47880 RepID=UPI001428BBE4|nr:hypothetical protein [Pseudomonas fulva]NIX95318.1 hypothetical protein [Pseudomonas fulva]